MDNPFDKFDPVKKSGSGNPFDAFDTPEPEGVLATMGREFASKIFPAGATALGGVTGGLGGAAIGGPAGGVAGDIALGSAAGAGARAIQESLIGAEESAANEAQLSANRAANPTSATIGGFIPFLISMLGGGSGIANKVGSAAAAGARAGGSEGSQQALETGDLSHIPDEMARSALAFGATGFLPAAKTILGAATGRAVGDAAAMTLANSIYDRTVHGKAVNFNDLAHELGGSIPAFALQNAIMGVMHGSPMLRKQLEERVPITSQRAAAMRETASQVAESAPLSAQALHKAADDIEAYEHQLWLNRANQDAASPEAAQGLKEQLATKEKEGLQQKVLGGAPESGLTEAPAPEGDVVKDLGIRPPAKIEGTESGLTQAPPNSINQFDVLADRGVETNLNRAKDSAAVIEENLRHQEESQAAENERLQRDLKSPQSTDLLANNLAAQEAAGQVLPEASPNRFQALVRAQASRRAEKMAPETAITPETTPDGSQSNAVASQGEGGSLETSSGSNSPEPIVEAKQPEVVEPLKSENAQSTEAGSKNTIFTKEAYLQARKRQQGRSSTGLDPSALKDWVYIGGYHIESGLRDFASWSRQMIAEGGAAIKSHLKSIWDTIHDHIGTPEESRIVSKEELRNASLESALDQLDNQAEITPNIHPAKFARTVRDSLGDDPAVLKEMAGLIGAKPDHESIARRILKDARDTIKRKSGDEEFEREFHDKASKELDAGTTDEESVAKRIPKEPEEKSPDLVDEEASVLESDLADKAEPEIEPEPMEEGDTVTFNDDGEQKMGSVSSINKDGSVTVEYRDPDEGVRKATLQPEEVYPQKLFEGSGLAFNPEAWTAAGRSAFRLTKDFARWSGLMIRKFGQGIKSALSRIWDHIKSILPNERGSIGSSGKEGQEAESRKSKGEEITKQVAEANKPKVDRVAVLVPEINKYREERGEKALDKPTVPKLPELQRAELAKKSSDPKYLPERIKDVLENGHSIPSDFPLFSARMQEIHEEQARLSEVTDDPKSTPEEKARAMVDHALLEDERLGSLEEALQRQGNIAGHTLYQRSQAAEGYSADAMIRRREMAKGEKLTPTERNDLTKQSEEIRKTGDDLADAQEAAEEASKVPVSKEDVQNKIEEAKAELEEIKKSKTDGRGEVLGPGQGEGKGAGDGQGEGAGKGPGEGGSQSTEVAKSKAERTKMTPEERREKQLEKRIAEYERRIKENDFSKKAKAPQIMTDKVIELQEKLNRRKKEYEDANQKLRDKKQGFWEKAGNWLVRLRRAFLISSSLVYGKLGAAVGVRGAITTAEELAGAGIGKIFPKLARAAKIEGVSMPLGFWRGLTKTTEQAIRGERGPEGFAKKVTQGIMEAIQNAKDIYKTGATKLDLVTGGKVPDGQKEWDDYLGRTHQMIKDTAKKAAFSSTMEKLLYSHFRDFGEMPDRATMVRYLTESYKAGNDAIFMGNNAAVGALRAAINFLERGESKPGKVFAKILRLLAPITTVPTNIVAEGMQMAGGLPIGVFKLAKLYKNAIGELDPKEADLVMRQLKKGSLGAALMTLGFLAPSAFGGSYQEGEKRKIGDVKPGGARIAGVDIPSWLMHAPAFEVLQMGATTRRVMESQDKNGNLRGAGAGVVAGMLGMAEEAPLMNEMLDLKDLRSPDGREHYVQTLAKSMIEPMALQKIAEFGDSGPPRKPENFRQELEMGIPGLREKVPVKASDFLPPSEKEIDPRISKYAATGAPVPSKPNKLELEKKNPGLSTNKWERYTELRGKLLKDSFMKALPELQGSDHHAQSLITEHLSHEATKSAKERLGLR